MSTGQPRYLSTYPPSYPPTFLPTYLLPTEVGKTSDESSLRRRPSHIVENTISSRAQAVFLRGQTLANLANEIREVFKSLGKNFVLKILKLKHIEAIQTAAKAIAEVGIKMSNLLPAAAVAAPEFSARSSCGNYGDITKGCARGKCPKTCASCFDPWRYSFVLKAVLLQVVCDSHHQTYRYVQGLCVKLTLPYRKTTPC